MDPKIIGIFAALGSAASWALGSILFKRISESVSVFGMTLSKGIVSLLLLGGALLLSGMEATMSVAITWQLCLSGLLGIAAGDTFFFAALRDLGPKLLVVFFMLSQALTALLAVAILGEAPSLQCWIGIAVVIAGVALTLWIRIRRDEAARPTQLRGILYGLAAMLCISFSIIIAKQALASTSPLWATFIRMAAGTAGMLLLGFGAHSLGDWLRPFQNRRLSLLFIASVCVVTFGGFWLSLVSIKYVDVTVANTVGAVEPIFVLPLAAVMLKERVTRLEASGALLTVCGVVLICIS